MKKFLSVVLSLMMVLSVGLGATSVMAATAINGSQETTEQGEDVVIAGVRVNGKNSSKVTYKKDATNKRIVTFTYEGSGTVDAWEYYDENDKLLVEGKDYIVLEKTENSIKVQFVEVFKGKVFADVAVTGADDDDPGHNGGNKSPATGAIAASGLAVAGLGVAVLASMKRKNDAE